MKVVAEESASACNGEGFIPDLRAKTDEVTENYVNDLTKMAEGFVELSLLFKA